MENFFLRFQLKQQQSNLHNLIKRTKRNFRKKKYTCHKHKSKRVNNQKKRKKKYFKIYFYAFFISTQKKKFKKNKNIKSSKIFHKRSIE